MMSLLINQMLMERGQYDYGVDQFEVGVLKEFQGRISANLAGCVNIG